MSEIKILYFYETNMIEFIKKLFKKNEDVVDGCLWLGHEDTDFLMDWAEADVLPELPKLDQVRYEYNQSAQDWSKQSCTIFSPMWAISDLINRKWTLAELKEVDELSYTKWRTRGKWWYVKSWVDCAVSWFNSKPELVNKYWKLMYKYIPTTDSETINKLIKKNYWICTGFYWDTAFSNDYYYDAILDWNKFTQVWWHAVTVVDNNWKRSVKDNYAWRCWKNKIPNNYYEVKHELKDINTWHNWCYVIYSVKDANADEIKRLEWIKTKCNNIITQLWELYNSVNDKTFQNELHTFADKLRKKISDANEQLQKYN